MSLLISRCLLTLIIGAIAFVALQKVWTRELDLGKLFGLVADQIPEKVPAHVITVRRVLFTRIAGAKNLEGRFAVLSPYMGIANNGQKETALAELRFVYEQNGGDFRVNVANASVTVSDGVNANVNGVVLKHGADYTVLGDWFNLAEVIEKNESKPPGGVWKGSAIFYLPSEVKSFDQISNFRMEVEDYLHQVTVLPLTDFEEDARTFLSEAYRVGHYKLVDGNPVFDN